MDSKETTSELKYRNIYVVYGVFFLNNYSTAGLSSKGVTLQQFWDLETSLWKDNFVWISDSFIKSSSFVWNHAFEPIMFSNAWFTCNSCYLWEWKSCRFGLGSRILQGHCQLSWAGLWSVWLLGKLSIMTNATIIWVSIKKTSCKQLHTILVCASITKHMN